MNESGLDEHSNKAVKTQQEGLQRVRRSGARYANGTSAQRSQRRTRACAASILLPANLTENYTMNAFTGLSEFGIWNAAIAAGTAAGDALVPVPMTVVEGDALSGQPLPNAKRYYVPSGVCGFAWVSFKGNTGFGRWAKRHGYARKAYGGGLQYWVSQYGQSMEKKEAFAHAMAESLRANGISAYAGSRMD